ncbi:MAG: RnfABCDGE type electron transport complex subunit B [Candidatus Methanoliparum thermophilum]|uniref:Ion-translocating oxidoreductase complex subunit B n=1 Tax=Methanoliparum thermophilum TaxID=2491083 RepID=A0A520KV71_METT2|nr:RnfABCDGE type electron transport complex subunit B [Candidatus Methanoliparum sp. LAM-1]RZN65611.1 MAG: RnfABCDGE type electron transport complex subunit B [Candidatus Methanoliparum thermophilum]BDC36489.1 electron transport complex protein RnfB [Candidatus Methanoliparum sp. LAM-1]
MIEIFTIVAVGFAFALILSIAADRFKVVMDEKVEKTIEILPGSNCGACGFSGCSAFAEALVKDPSLANKCAQTYMDKEKVKALSDLFGGEAGKKQKAVVLCNGGTKCTDKFEYDGEKSCSIAANLFQGNKSCEYGCLGFGDCVKVCPTLAIKMNDEGIPLINLDKCTGCGACVEVCPRKIIKIVPEEVPVFVACNNPTLWEDDLDVFFSSIHDKGKFTAMFDKIEVYKDKIFQTVGCTRCLKCIDICPRGALEFTVLEKNLSNADTYKITKTDQGRINWSDRFCIYCKRCEKICPENVISVEKPLNGSFNIDQNKCVECENCINLCPADNLSFTEGKNILFDNFCIYCGLCEAVCPTSAITVEVNEEDRPIKKIQNYCSNICKKCKLCIDACDKNAIRWDEKQNLPKIDYDLCKDCLSYACIDSCPLHIIKMVDREEEKVPVSIIVGR